MQCQEILSTVRDLSSPLPTGLVLTDKEAAVAFLHVRRCTSCKAALTPQEYTWFVSRVLLENE
jgi:hypothetical protein